MNAENCIQVINTVLLVCNKIKNYSKIENIVTNIREI